MTNVLADLALESEAATVLMMRLARAYDEDDRAGMIWRRVVTPAAKFWICKRAPLWRPRPWRCSAAAATSRNA